MTFDGRDAGVQSGIGVGAVLDFLGQLAGKRADFVLQLGVSGGASVGFGQNGSAAVGDLGSQVGFEFAQRVVQLGGGTEDFGLGFGNLVRQQRDERVVHVRVVVDGGGDLAQRVEQLGSDALQVGDGLVGVRLGVGNAGNQVSAGRERVNDDSAVRVQAGELQQLVGGVDPDAASGGGNRVSSQALDVQVLDDGVVGKSNAMKLGVSHVFRSSEEVVLVIRIRCVRTYPFVAELTRQRVRLQAHIAKVMLQVPPMVSVK